MKKLLIILLFFLTSAALLGQLQGSGTFSDPYYGTVDANTTITKGSTGVRYVSFDGIVVVSGTLTIQAGTTLAFLNSGFISVEGDGILYANGTSTSNIRFTANDDGDGNFGETGETWGGISLASSNGSTFNYCTFDHGMYSALINGINLFVMSDSHTITNCTFSNNLYNAEFDGACIYVGDGVDPYSCTITNCSFSNNSSMGVYVSTASSMTVNNSSFYSNTRFSVFSEGDIYINSSRFYNNTSSVPVKATSGYLLLSNSLINNNNGGSAYAGAMELVSTETEIVNSTIVLNSTTKTNWPGGVYISSQISTTIVNSLLWRNRRGSTVIDDISTATITWSNSAISETITGQIDLDNSNNLGSLGPNFVNPTSQNYNITVLSPCRDAGTNSYTGLTIPSTDLAGNSRIGTTDIGAYENIYTKWTGGTSTAWETAGNWSNGLPGSSKDGLISNGITYDPLINSNAVVSNLVSESGSDLIINSGYSVTVSSFNNGGTLKINPTGYATITNLSNSGTINLESDATGMFSLLTNSYSGTGTVNTEIYFTGGDAGTGEYRWHYMAPPKTMNKSELLSDISTDNLLRYDDSRITGTTPTKELGWQWHDGWDGSAPDPLDAFTPLDEGRGYNFYHSNPSGATATLTSTGILASVPLIYLSNSYTGTNRNLYGWNLVGNSHTCSLDWDLITRSSDSVRNAVYYTIDNSMAAYVDGFSVNGGDKYIPPLQGFFIKTTVDNEYLDLSSAKVHATSQSYYKKGSTSPEKTKSLSPDKPHIRLELEGNINKDELVIRFEDNATNRFDGNYDASKWVSPASISQFYSIMTDDEYCINAIPYPENSVVIPLGIKIPENGSYTIRRTGLYGLEAYNIYLNDAQLSSSVNLKETDYIFSGLQGSSETRFTLTFTNSVATGINDVILPQKNFKVYTAFGKINIAAQRSETGILSGNVKLYDINGKLIRHISRVEFNGNNPLLIDAPNTRGIYIVEIITGTERFVEKVAIINN